MRVARSLEEAVEFGPVAVTIGNFDGVHLAHRQLLHQVVEAAKRTGASPAVLTFDPHPASVVSHGTSQKGAGPPRPAHLLTTHAERCSLMAREGIEYVLILPFTPELSRWTPERFVEDVLHKALHAKIVIVGENFRFGHKQAGDVAMLRQLGQKFGFEICAVSPVQARGRVVSSSAVRQAVESGNVALAGRLLGQCFALAGDVVSGQGIGKKQTVPTLNLNTASQVLPSAGVYITRTHDQAVPARQWNSITNVGYRPTFESGQNELTIETFLLDKFEEPTPTAIQVEFLRRVRDEKKFDSPEALRAQIMKDVGRANAYFRRLPK